MLILKAIKTDDLQRSDLMRLHHVLKETIKRDEYYGNKNIKERDERLLTFFDELLGDLLKYDAILLGDKRDTRC